MEAASLFKDIPAPILTLIIVGLFWILNKLWDYKSKSHDQKNEQLQQNTLALVELRVELKSVKETFLSLHRKVENLEEDVDHLHRKKRESTKNGN